MILTKEMQVLVRIKPQPSAAQQEGSGNGWHWGTSNLHIILLSCCLALLLLLLYVWLLLVLPTNPPQHPQLPGELLRRFFLSVVGLWTQRIWSCHEKNLGLLALLQLGKKKEKKSLPVRLTPTFLNCISLCLPVCLSILRKLCCKTRTFPSLLTVFLNLCATAVDLLTEMLVCVPQLTFFQLLAPQALVRSLLLINFFLLLFVVWTSCCNSRCQSQGKGSIYKIYTPQFFLRVLHNTWRKLGKFGGW